MTQLHNQALIVEDEDPVRYAISKDMRNLGYDCVTVSSGEEALDALATQRFDLVMLDLRMPGMSGLEFLSKFRPGHPEPCVVVLTALVDADLAGETFRLGADGYLTKPWASIDLGAKLREAHDRREQARQDEAQRLSGEEPASHEIDLQQITADLIAQQLTDAEGSTSHQHDGGDSGQRRRWWPWGRRS